MTAASVEFLKFWYVLGVALGAFSGAVTNFLMGRHWSFEATHGEVQAQAKRYFFVSAASLGLNTFGVWLVTEQWRWHYLLSKVTVAILVGFFFNFPLHRKYVFR